MRIPAFAVSLILCSGVAVAQTPSPSQPNMTMEGVTLGQSMRQIRDSLGDPVQLSLVGDQTIWRYLEHGGAVFMDVIPRNNVVSSITVVRRFDDSPYADDRGASFGMSASAVRAKMGAPTKSSTNGDDGSVDLWYVTGDTARIYEFFGDKLGFVQILARPGSQSTAEANAPPMAPDDGSSVARAIRIRPSSMLANTSWIDAYLAMNQCGNGGHWHETSSSMQDDPATKDVMAYVVVHATCTAGSVTRTFYFDTHGALTNAAQPGQGTMYIDTRQLQMPPQTSPSPAPVPS